MCLFQVVCGSDHVTYENVCDLRAASCHRKSNVTVLAKGQSCGELKHVSLEKLAPGRM